MIICFQPAKTDRMIGIVYGAEINSNSTFEIKLFIISNNRLI